MNNKENIMDFLFTVIENESLNDEYQTVLSADLLELPLAIDNFMLAFRTKNEFLYKLINHYQIFNDLFINTRINSAIKLTKNTIIDLELSDTKIEKIYNKFMRDWVPNENTANLEIKDFYSFLKILNA